MTKPTELPRWGTDQSNEVTPSSGQQDTGWELSSLGVSSFDNWAKRLTFEWLAYLDSGEYDGDLHVLGDLVVDDTSTFTGGIAGNPNFTGNVTIGGTLGVTGLITATAGLTAAVNQSITLSGTGRLKTGSRSYLTAILHGDIISDGASGSTSAPGVTLLVSSTTYIPIKGLHQFEQLSSVYLWGDALSGTVTASLVLSFNGGAFSGPIAGTTTSFGAAVTVITPSSPILMTDDVLTTGGTTYWIKVVVAALSSGFVHAYRPYFTAV